jgi:hypothetical protein
LSKPELVPLLRGVSEGSAFALRERVAAVWGIIGILFMVFFAEVRISSFSTLDG